VAPKCFWIFTFPLRNPCGKVTTAGKSRVNGYDRWPAHQQAEVLAIFGLII
jgi:hypothetical protein